MILLAWKNLLRRPWRTGLALAGVAIAMATLTWLSGLGAAYQRTLSNELDRMGVQLMLVPLGCPYDAAARVLKDNALESSIPASVLDIVRKENAVAVAAPLLIAALPRISEKRVDLWVGIDGAARELKPWWKAQQGSDWFQNDDSVILGAEAAEIEMRSPGDKLFSPETGWSGRIVGVLQRSGTSDDSVFFIPLAAAQRMFHQEGRLTAVAVRLRDPTQLKSVADRLQQLPGIQVVTLTEMMGTFLNLLGSVRTLLQSIAVLALAVALLTVLNTLLAAVVERTNELSLFRAIGASRFQVVRIISAESLLLTMGGTVAGLLFALVCRSWFEGIVKRFVPFAPNATLISIQPEHVGRALLLAAIVGILAGAFPAWKASRAHPAKAVKEL